MNLKMKRTNRETMTLDSQDEAPTEKITVVKSTVSDVPFKSASPVVTAPVTLNENTEPSRVIPKETPVLIENSEIASNVMSRIPRSVKTLKVADCYPHSLFQPRTYFNPMELQSLADNMKKLGQVQPIIVVKENDKYLIVSGERRFRALKLNNSEFVDAVVLDNKDEAVEIAYFDNEARSNLSFIEKLVYWRKLLDSGWASGYKEISDKLGVDYQFVARASKVHLISESVKEELIRTNAGRPAVVKALQSVEKGEATKTNRPSEMTTIKFSIEEKNGIPLTLKGLGNANIKTLEYLVSEASRMIKNLK